MAETLTAPPEAGSATIEDRQAGVESEVRHLRERMDDRLDVQDKLMDARFGGVGKQFDGVAARFEAQDKLIDARFGGVGKRFGAVDARLNEMGKRITMLMWVMGGAAAAGLAMLSIILQRLLSL